MHNKAIIIVVAVTLAVLLAVYAIEQDPHNFPASRCGSCHEKDAAGNILEHRMTAPITELCRECHEKIIKSVYMHPVNVKPRRVIVPNDMPLSSYGDITCSTCHDVHGTYFTVYGTQSYYLRRGETGRAFCSICHKDAGFPRAGHRGILGEAHFRSKYIATDPSQEIDSMSKNCISCHDGSFATSATIKAGYWSHGEELISNDMGSHPIGIDYEAARVSRRRSLSDLRPMAMVDPRIRFFDGRIGCGSCHDPYSTIEKQLVMSDINSRLCLACHLMDKGG
jgi:predicted CXXCH cytochrome family protein